MQIKCVFSKKGAWLRFFMLGNSLLWKFFCANSRKKKKNPTFKMKSQNYNDISFCFPVLTFTSNGLRLSVVPKWIFVFVIHLWRSLLWRWSAVCLQKKSWIQNIISTYEKKKDETIVAFNQLIDISIEKKSTKNRSQLKNNAVSIKNWNNEVVGI